MPRAQGPLNRPTPSVNMDIETIALADRASFVDRSENGPALDASSVERQPGRHGL